jgi:23S rRNA (cytidine1920-2'-O)/16S rRNA (cytidine1409-2'-O)-methyltransferase
MRLDQALVVRQLVATRSLAQKLISEGRVLRNGVAVTKANANIAEADCLELTGEARFVSRGGEKLEGALQAFGVAVSGRVCMDVGASTGGFTDCLLQHGADRVYAFDVGRDQLAPRLKDDSRVIWREGFNARYLTTDDLPEKPELAVTDVSFISLTLILPAMVSVMAAGGEIICLIKPQFELSKAELGKGGIVRDPALREQAVARVQTCAAGLGLKCLGLIDSPIEGGDGNREFLAHYLIEG